MKYNLITQIRSIESGEYRQIIDRPYRSVVQTVHALNKERGNKELFLKSINGIIRVYRW